MTMPEHVGGTESPDPIRDRLEEGRAKLGGFGEPVWSQAMLDLKHLRAELSSLLTEREELREALREIEDWEPKRGNVQDAFDNVKAVARSVLSSRETTESNTSDERVAISAENEPPGLCPTCGRTGPDTLDVDFDTGATEAACGDPFHSTDSGKD